MNSQQIHDMLNYLVDHRIACSIKNASGYATLLRYEPLISFNDESKEYFDKYPDKCYVFEIGKNCGTVFSSSLVKSIEFTGDHADITLK